MATITEKGSLIVKGDIASGQTTTGSTWKRMTIVMEIPGFSGSLKRVALSVSGDLVDTISQYPLKTSATVTYSVSAREWKEKWYNNVDLIRFELDEPTSSPLTTPVPAEEEGDLPF